MKWVHWLMGHKQTRVKHRVYMGSRGPAMFVEQGRVEFGTKCSCGRLWWDKWGR